MQLKKQSQNVNHSLHLNHTKAFDRHDISVFEMHTHCFKKYERK